MSHSALATRRPSLYTKALSNLSQLGAKIAEPLQPSDYAAADLNKASANGLLDKQAKSLAYTVFGTRLGLVSSLADRLITKDKLENVQHTAFAKLCQWAQRWAMADIAKDARFAQIAAMDDEARLQFAQEIVNQHRALATLGSAANLAGLKGVLVDSVWFLLVSLRGVYQLAAVFQQPLSDDVGAQQVYALLDAANLNALQQKQLLLIALALTDKLFDESADNNLAAGLSAMGVQLDEFSLYTTALAQFAKQGDFDKYLSKINNKWLSRLAPLAATAVSVHYNRQLIDEVLGVALATFGTSSTSVQPLIEAPKADPVAV